MYRYLVSWLLFEQYHFGNATVLAVEKDGRPSDAPGEHTRYTRNPLPLVLSLCATLAFVTVNCDMI